MTLLVFTNQDWAGDVCLDARLSNGDEPFFELEQAPGFPRCLRYEESAEIETGDYKEVLYRRALRGSWLFELRRVVMNEPYLQRVFIQPSSMHPSKTPYKASTPPPLVADERIEHHWLFDQRDDVAYLRKKIWCYRIRHNCCARVTSGN